MSRIKIILLSMLAVFAFSAVMASAASAHRVWTVCKEVAGPGTEPPVKFDNSACNTKAKPLAERKWEDVILPVGETRSLTVVGPIGKFEAELEVPLAGETIVCKEVALKTGNTIQNVMVEGKGPTGRDTGITVFTKCSNPGKPACTVHEPIEVNSPTSLVENAAQTKIYDMFRPKGRTELTPAEVTAKGEPASKQAEEILSEYVKIEQTGASCTAISPATAEGNGVAAEISPEGMSVKKKFKFPCPTVITPVKLWNGIEESLKLKAFGFAAKECIPEIEVELTTKGGWDVQ